MLRVALQLVVAIRAAAGLAAWQRLVGRRAGLGPLHNRQPMEHPVDVVHHRPTHRAAAHSEQQSPRLGSRSRGRLKRLRPAASPPMPPMPPPALKELCQSKGVVEGVAVAYCT